MAALFSVSSHQNPTHTFFDKKPPLMPRQSTSDVLSFTHIIANRLASGQSVWEYFSPAPSPSSDNSEPACQSPLSPVSSTRGASPTHSPRPSLSLLSSMFSPVSPVSPRNSSSASQNSSRNNSPRQSLALEGRPSQATEAPEQDCNSKSDQSSPPISTSNNTPASSGSPLSVTTTPSSNMAASTTSVATPSTPTPTTQKRRSFAQSFRNSMMSLSQLLSPAASLSTSPSSSCAPLFPGGTPHYNVLVLGSDSSPLASTLYKMSSLLPETTKIQHYQEISGFFVAHFRSNDTVRPPSPWREGVEEVKSRRQSLQDEEIPAVAPGRTSTSSSSSSSLQKESQNDAESDSPSREAPLRFNDGYDLISSKTCTLPRDSGAFTNIEPSQETCNKEESNTVASLSVHAFSIDQTWPVPRILAQTFWFPHAHGIVYIVDAARKKDPRGMDHLVSARQFLTSLVSDPHFKRKDIPVVVFANKAGCDPETCYSIEEIAEILGCDEWDVTGNGGVECDPKTGSKRSRPWSIKSTRTDAEGKGIRESVEWLKSRMSEVWA